MGSRGSGGCGGVQRGPWGFGRGGQQVPVPPQHPPSRKKVSCWSRAGCCCGWNSASKFQKELSTKLSVGISVNLGGRRCLRKGGRGPSPHPEPPPAHSPHLQEDLAQLRAHLEQGVQVAAGQGQPQGGEVVGFEGQPAPGASAGGVGGHGTGTPRPREGPGGVWGGRGRTWRSSPGSAPSPAAPRPC